MGGVLEKSKSAEKQSSSQLGNQQKVVSKNAENQSSTSREEESPNQKVVSVPKNEDICQPQQQPQPRSGSYNLNRRWGEYQRSGQVNSPEII